MNRNWSSILSLLVLSGAVLGCGRLPSRLKTAAQKPTPAPAPAPTLGGFEARGFRWSIREAKPRAQDHLQSPFELGSPISVQALISEDRAELAAPILWPKNEPARLALELSPAPEGVGAGWSYRCLFPDGRVADDSQQEGEVRPMVLDREAGVGLILLEKVFGERGERQDPATQCHIEVRLAGEKPFVVSLRALGDLPALESVATETPASLGEVFRTEVWSNSTLRRVAFRPSPEVDLESRQFVRETRYPESRGNPPPQAQVRIKRARGRGFEVEASVDGGSWKLAALTRIIFGPQESHEIRFRLRLGRSTSRHVMPEPVLRHFDWVEERTSTRGEFDPLIRRQADRQETTEILETRFFGGVRWKGVLEEVGGWGEARVLESGRSLMGELPQSGKGPAASEDESFDWEGWVS